MVYCLAANTSNESRTKCASLRLRNVTIKFQDLDRKLFASNLPKAIVGISINLYRIKEKIKTEEKLMLQP